MRSPGKPVGSRLKVTVSHQGILGLIPSSAATFEAIFLRLGEG